jgi:hypothetical protein
MRIRTFQTLCLAVLVPLTLAASLSAAATPAAPVGVSGQDSPAVFFPQKAFEFQPVIDGVKVVHDFDVLNKGSSPLLITNVRTG